MANALQLQPIGNAYEGTDGIYQPFLVNISSNGIGVQVFPSTVVSDFWAISSAVCSGYGSAVANCSRLRGGTFDPALSNTWQTIGQFSTGIEEQYGWPQYSPTGAQDAVKYGYDTVVLTTPKGFVPVNNVAVGSANTNATGLGLLGLASKPSTFPVNSTTTVTVNSTLQILKNAQQIPSLSFSYTAGAYNGGNNLQPASLVLGGYDANSFVPNNVTWAFAPDSNNYLNVALQGITTNVNGSTTTLSTDSIRVLIDSTIGSLWLPQDICDNFASAFNLQYSSINQLYTLNSSSITTNNQNNASVTFKLAVDQVGGDTVSITLPWTAFDQSYIDPNKLTYQTAFFPLRVASSSSQYTLGRAFLQGAVLTVDHERQNFSVSQVTNLAASGYQPSIVNIASPSTTSGGASPSGSLTAVNGGGGGISGGAIGGIVVAAVVIIAAILGFFFWRRQKNQQKKYASPEMAQAETPGPQPLPAANRQTNEKGGAVELNTPQQGSSNGDYFGAYAAQQRSHHKHQMSGQSNELEGDGFDSRGRARSPAPAYTTIHESPVHDGPSAPAELPAGLTASELHSRHVSSNSIPLPVQGFGSNASSPPAHGLGSTASSPPVNSPISELAPSPGEDGTAHPDDMGWNSPAVDQVTRQPLTPTQGGARLRDIPSPRSGARNGSNGGNPSVGMSRSDNSGMSATSGPMGLGLMGTEREPSESLRRNDSVRSRASDSTLVSGAAGQQQSGSGSAALGGGGTASGSGAAARKS